MLSRLEHGGPSGLGGPGDPVLLILRFHAGDGHAGSGLWAQIDGNIIQIRPGGYHEDTMRI